MASASPRLSLFCLPLSGARSTRRTHAHLPQPHNTPGSCRQASDEDDDAERDEVRITRVDIPTAVHFPHADRYRRPAREHEARRQRPVIRHGKNARYLLKAARQCCAWRNRTLHGVVGIRLLHLPLVFICRAATTRLRGCRRGARAAVKAASILWCARLAVAASAASASGSGGLVALVTGPPCPSGQPRL